MPSVGASSLQQQLAMSSNGMISSRSAFVTSLNALSTVRGMHVRGVAGEQHSSLAVGGRLPAHIGEIPRSASEDAGLTASAFAPKHFPTW
jgi:hypothetical protein